jgi:hypothetical protein
MSAKSGEFGYGIFSDTLRNLPVLLVASTEARATKRDKSTMKKLWHKFWRDERAAITSASIILTYTILALGAVVGLVCMRNQIVQELGDLGVAFDNLDQSYSVDWDGDGTIDASYDDPGPTLLDPTGAPAGINLDRAAEMEGGGIVTNTPGEP